MTVKNRIKEFCKSENLSISAFEDTIRVSNGYVNSISKSIGIDKLNTILEIYPNINLEWLLTGKGKMLKGQEEVLDTESKLNVKPLNETRSIDPIKEIQSIPLYNIVATAGIKEFVDNSSQFATEFIQIPNIPTCDGAIHISGNSIEPILKSGEIVAYKMLSPSLDNVIYGRIYIVSYVIDGDANVVVKRIERSEAGEPYIKLSSENPIHKPVDIDFRRVNALASIKASINISSME